MPSPEGGVLVQCHFSSGPLFYLEYQFRLFWLARKVKTDVLFAVDLDTLPAAVLLKYWKGCTLFFDAHEYFEEVPELVHAPLKKMIWKWLGKIFVPRCDRVFTVNPSLADIFSAKYQRSIEVVRNVPSCDTPRTVKSSADIWRHYQSKDFSLVYQGAINVGRGLEAMLEVVQRLDEPFSLHIYGDGDIKESLFARAQSKGILGRVHFYGKVDPVVLHTETAKYWLGINILENTGLNYYYSLANKFFDYMHAGVPSLNSDFPEYRRIIEQWNTGLLTEDLAPDTIAQHILKLASSMEAYRQFYDNNLKAKTSFCWENEVQTMSI